MTRPRADRAEVTAELRARAEEEYQRRRLAAWRDTVPQRLREVDLATGLADGWHGRLERSELRKLRHWVAEPEGTLILRGGEGLGKTTAAVAVGTELLAERDITPRYRSVPRLLERFSWDREVDHIGACVEPGLLLLDDIGAGTESISDHQRRCLWQVLDSRWAEEKLTVLTTNMAISSRDGQGMIDWFGPSAWGRVSEGATVVNFSGDSFRGEH